MPEVLRHPIDDDDSNTELVSKWLNLHKLHEGLSLELKNLTTKREVAFKNLNTETGNLLKLVNNNVLRKVFVFSETAVIIEHEKGVTAEPIRNSQTTKDR